MKKKKVAPALRTLFFTTTTKRKEIIELKIYAKATCAQKTVSFSFFFLSLSLPQFPPPKDLLRCPRSSTHTFIYSSSTLPAGKNKIQTRITNPAQPNPTKHNPNQPVNCADRRRGGFTAYVVRRRGGGGRAGRRRCPWQKKRHFAAAAAVAAAAVAASSRASESLSLFL